MHPRRQTQMTIATLLVLWSACATAPDAQSAAPEQRGRQSDAYTHYLVGVIHQRAGEYEEALKEFRKASDLAPGSLSLDIRLIQYYVDLQDYPNAEQMCKRVLEQRREDASLWIILGRIYQEQDKYEDAAQAFQKAVELKPSRPEDYQRLILAGEQANDQITTIDVLEKFIELNPKSDQLHLQLGLTYLRINNVESARAAFEQAIGINAGLSQAQLLLGVCLLELGDAPAAAEHFRTFIEQSPDDDEGHVYLAGALGQQGQYQAAADELKTVIARGGSKPQHLLDMMYLLIRAGRFDEASEAIPPNGAPILGTLMRAWSRKMSSQPYRPLVDSLDSVEGEIDVECTEYLNSLLFRYGKEDAGEFIIATLKGMRDEGVRSKYVDLVLARTYISLEKNAEAGEVLEAALTQYGPDKWTHYYLGTVYEALDKVKDAEKHLKATLAIDPEDAEVMNFLGYLYAEKDINLDEAEKLLNRALAIEPDNAFYLDSLGWIYYRQGKADRAIESIRKAIVLMTSDDAVLRDHLGDVYLLKGDRTRAVGEWERAHRLDPKLEGVQEKIEKHKRKLQK